MSEKQRRARRERRRRAAKVAIGAGAGAGAALAFAPPAIAQDFTVTNLDDSGTGSLRQAIADANAQAGADRILFQSGLTGTIRVRSELEVFSQVEIIGPGADQLALSGDHEHQIMLVHPDVALPLAELEVSGLTFKNGGTAEASESDPGNMFGGAIAAYVSDLTIADSVFTGNASNTAGGAVYFVGDADSPGSPRQAKITGSTFTGNISAYGGAVVGAEGEIAIDSSTFAGNEAETVDAPPAYEDGRGGAIFTPSFRGDTAFTITNSTFSGNRALRAGGVIAAFAPDTPDPGEDPPTTSFTIESSTLSGNRAGSWGGAVGPGFVSGTLNNSIISGNDAAQGRDLFSAYFDPDMEGPFSTRFKTSFDLIGRTDGADIVETVPGSNLIGANAGLSPLADNGGPTPTMAISPTSAALNKGSSALSVDQRGSTRPILYPDVPNSSAAGANGADIGAFELPAPPLPNDFTFGKVKLNKKKGVATLQVKVPGAGKVQLVGSKTVKGLKETAKGKATIGLTVRAKGKATKQLKKKGKATVKATVAFTPTGGAAKTKSKTVKLVKKKPKNK